MDLLEIILQLQISQVGMTLMPLQVLKPISESTHSLGRAKVVREPGLKVMICTTH